MCGSGGQTGMPPVITSEHRIGIPRDRSPVSIAFFAGARGTATRGSCGLRFAAGAFRLIASTSSASVAPSEFLRILISVFCFLWVGWGRIYNPFSGKPPEDRQIRQKREDEKGGEKGVKVQHTSRASRNQDSKARETKCFTSSGWSARISAGPKFINPGNTEKNPPW